MNIQQREIENTHDDYKATEQTEGDDNPTITQQFPAFYVTNLVNITLKQYFIIAITLPVNCRHTLKLILKALLVLRFVHKLYISRFGHYDIGLIHNFVSIKPNYLDRHSI